MADIQSQQATLKEDYTMDKKALQETAKLKVLGKTLMARGGKTFDSKVAWVKKHMPEITDPEAFVASALRSIGEIK
jgi:hypothetical protein